MSKPPETASQKACREWWQGVEPHVTRSWGRSRDGAFLAPQIRLLHQAWEAAQATRPEPLADPTWDAHFMQMAELVAQKSKDPSTKVGAVIVDDRHRALSQGFNGPPRGTDDSVVHNRDQKLLRSLHAELNAVLFARGSIEGATIYVTRQPCGPCAAVLVQAGIRRVVHPPADPAFAERWGASMREGEAMMVEAGVERSVFIPNQEEDEDGREEA